MPLLFAALMIFSTVCAADWISTYEQWIDPNNHFVEFLDDYDQARVILIGSASFCTDGEGARPTSSEGMGYGLLLACAHNDQTTFDKFLRYILAASEAYGSCQEEEEEEAPSQFLMPRVVNQYGAPFWFQFDCGSTPRFSSGSSTAGDLKIALGLNMASQKVMSGSWENSLFQTSQGEMGYQEIFAALADAIRSYDMIEVLNRYSPGSHMQEAGEFALYPGYLIPQAFALLDIPWTDIVAETAYTISDFQKTYKTGLFPNVIYYDHTYPICEWSNSYAFEACCFPLWVSAFIAKNPDDPNAPHLQQVLTNLLNSLSPFVKNGTLPSGGIEAFTEEAIGDWESTPAFNAPVYLAALYTGNTDLAEQLKPALYSYDITEHRPQSTDPIGYKYPYYNAAILLTAQAIEQGLL